MKEQFYTVIGLEVHIQLNTSKKIFCNCKNSYGDPANTNICPICTGQPGTLPVFNKDVLRKALIFSYALNCKLNLFTRFDRKNYFYPDSAKNYQITQHDYPIGYDGEFYYYSETGQRSINIKSIQIEEDSAKVIYENDSKNSTCTIDYNRAGIPLLEIISEPSFHNLNDVVSYLEFLKRTARFLKISDCNMEEGSLRVDANISISSDKGVIPDYKVEIKNLNSFTAVKNALHYEETRQIGLLKKGKKGHSETKGWDKSGKKTFTMREKEQISDYRYIPEPDIPPFLLSEKEVFSLKNDAELTPYFIINNLVNNYHIDVKQAYKITAYKNLYEYFVEVSKYTFFYDEIINLLLGDVVYNLKKENMRVEDMKMVPEILAEAIKKIENKELTGRILKSIFPDLINGRSLDVIIKDKKIKLIDEKKLTRIIDSILKNTSLEKKKFSKNEESVIKYFMGKIMDKTNGNADPEVARKILENKLKK